MNAVNADQHNSIFHNRRVFLDIISNYIFLVLVEYTIFLHKWSSYVAVIEIKEIMKYGVQRALRQRYKECVWKSYRELGEIGCYRRGRVRSWRSSYSLLQQSTRFCSDSETNWPVFFLWAPSMAPVEENAQQEPHWPWTSKKIGSQLTFWFWPDYIGGSV